MADLHYRDNIYGNQAAIHGFGQGLRNAVLGAEALRLRQQQEAQQAAYQAAQIDLQNRQLAARAPMLRSQQEHFDAQSAGLNQQRMAGQDLGFNLQQMQQARQLPMASQDAGLLSAIQSRIMQQQGIIAATHPANIGEQVPQILQGADPRMQALMATKTKMEIPVSAGGTVYNAASQRPEYTAPGGPQSLTFEQRLELARRAYVARLLSEQMSGMSKQITYGATAPDQSKLNDFVAQAIPRAYGGSTTNAKPQFAHNPETKERLVSVDGGESWSPVIQAPALKY